MFPSLARNTWYRTLCSILNTVKFPWKKFKIYRLKKLYGIFCLSIINLTQRYHWVKFAFMFLTLFFMHQFLSICPFHVILFVMLQWYVIYYLNLSTLLTIKNQTKQLFLSVTKRNHYFETPCILVLYRPKNDASPS